MTPDPAAARARAAILREEAASLPEPARGLLLSRALFLEQFARELERLRTGTKRGIQSRMLAAEPRKSTLYTDDAKMKAFLKVANAAGHTLNSVAKAVRKEFGQGSHVNIGKAIRGEKPIRMSWAAYIASQTVSEAFPKGFEATAAHYPAGWVPEQG